jgi:hypothetical protein
VAREEPIPDNPVPKREFCDFPQLNGLLATTMPIGHNPGAAAEAAEVRRQAVLARTLRNDPGNEWLRQTIALALARP